MIDTAFARAVARFGPRPFLLADGVEASFGEVAERVLGLTARLEAAGVRAGYRVAVALDNGPEFFPHLLALNRLGASVVPVTPETPAESLGEARVAGLIAFDARADTPVPAGTPDRLPTFTGEPAAWADEAALLFTSGTTGRPKRCVLSNRYFTRIGAHYAGLGGLCAFRPEGERLLTPLPVTHMNALACSFMVAVQTGSALIALDRFRASSWWETVRTTRATAVHYLGVMPAILLQHPPSGADRDHAIRFGFGAGVDPRHHAAFEARFGFPLVEAWAMTETGAGAWITASAEPRHVGARCFGRAGAEVEVHIVRDNGAEAAADEPGELLVRAAGEEPRDGFFSGYDRDPEASEAAWAGGWFHTGDIVRRGADGSMFFVDRSKNIVRRSGENIAALEVEAVLLTHPTVAACAVLPLEDELRGEEVMALVVAEGEPPQAEALHDWVAAALPYYKVPGWIAFVDELPVTPSQKLQRGAIRALGRTLVEGGQAHDLRALKRRR